MCDKFVKARDQRLRQRYHQKGVNNSTNTEHLEGVCAVVGNSAGDGVGLFACESGDGVGLVVGEVIDDGVSQALQSVAQR